MMIEMIQLDVHRGLETVNTELVKTLKRLWQIRWDQYEKTVETSIILAVTLL